MSPEHLAIVTGTSRGIGRAVVDALLARGVEVVGISRTAADFGGASRYRHFACDLGDTEDVRRVFDDEIQAAVSFERRERIGLVNNAARLDVESVVETRLDHLAASLMVNVAVPVFLHGWLLRRAPRDAVLRIVDLSSGAATSPYPGWVAYCATKAALDMADRVLAAELDEVPGMAGRDVAIVSYAPHVVATGMQERIRAAPESSFPRRGRFVRLHEDGELVGPEGPAAEIAEMLLAAELPRFSRRRFRPNPGVADT